MKGPHLSLKVWGGYAVLLLVAVPWYWPADDKTRWAGVPAWVVVSLAGSVVVSLYTAWLLRRPWPSEEE
jgi:hypothetical protein|tara:strand:+ start:656 stop:862 length:207 start_codon:yes stop_codon:yes gene_type:complete